MANRFLCRPPIMVRLEVSRQFKGRLGLSPLAQVIAFGDSRLARVSGRRSMLAPKTVIPKVLCAPLVSQL